MTPTQISDALHKERWDGFWKGVAITVFMLAGTIGIALAFFPGICR